MSRLSEARVRPDGARELTLPSVTAEPEETPGRMSFRLGPVPISVYAREREAPASKATALIRAEAFSSDHPAAMAAST